MNRTDLIAALRRFPPRDDQVAAHVATTIAFIESEPDAFKRTLAKGHVVGSGLLLTGDGGTAALMHHVNLNRIQQFGGHCDGDENVAAVSVREAAEESGIDESKIHLLSPEIFDVDVHVIPYRASKNEAEHIHYDIRYVLYTTETQFAMGDSGVGSLLWADREKTRELFTEPSLIRMWQLWNERYDNGTIAKQISELKVRS